MAYNSHIIGHTSCILVLLLVLARNSALPRLLAETGRAGIPRHIPCLTRVSFFTSALRASRRIVQLCYWSSSKKLDSVDVPEDGADSSALVPVVARTNLAQERADL